MHRDELLFQTVHQASELWLKLATTEAEEATRLIGSGDLGGAIRLLRRAVDCLKIVTQALDMLEHLSPWEYQEIRKVLGHGSGFDSPGFRAIQKLMPALGAAFHKAREAAGLSLRDVYTEGRQHEDLYQLAELLIEWDERVVVWRVRHFVVVERIIGGAVIGTQGTPVEVLGKLIHKRFFPDLWELRNELDRAVAVHAVTWPRVALGCGNFGGIGSAPAFFGQGNTEEEAFAIMDAAWERGIRWFDTADAYGGGRSEAVHRPLARRPPPGRAARHDQGLQPGHRRPGRPRARPRPDQARGRGKPRPARRRADRPLPRPRAGSRRRRSPRPSAPSRSSSPRARSPPGASATTTRPGSRRRSPTGGRRSSRTPTRSSTATTRPVLPLCGEHGIAYVPFGPLAGGWLTGKYTRGAEFPPGSRMTLRPEPYERLVDDRVFDGLDRLAAEAAARGIDMATLAFAWVLSHPHVTGAVCGPSRPAHLEPVLAALDLPLSAEERERIGSFFA